MAYAYVCLHTVYFTGVAARAAAAAAAPRYSSLASWYLSPVGVIESSTVVSGSGFCKNSCSERTRYQMHAAVISTATSMRPPSGRPIARASVAIDGEGGG